MRNLAAAWDRYWFRDAPLVDLAVLRLVAVGHQLARMLAGGLGIRLERAAERADADYAPVLLVQALSAGSRPTEALVHALHGLTLAAGFFALVGLATRASLWVFALGVLFLQGYAYSFGMHSHPEAALCIALVALAASPSGGTLSLDRLLARRRAEGAPLPEKSPFAGWPLLLVQWILALVFFSAAASKLANAGFAWTNGYTLQYFAFAKGEKLHTPLGVWLSGQHELCIALSWIVLLFEASFFLVLVRRQLAWLYAPLAAAILISIELTVGARFHPLLVLLCVFVRWHRLSGGSVLRADAAAPGRARSRESIHGAASTRESRLRATR